MWEKTGVKVKFFPQDFAECKAQLKEGLRELTWMPRSWIAWEPQLAIEDQSAIARPQDASGSNQLTI